MEGKVKFIQQTPQELTISQGLLDNMDNMLADIESDRIQLRGKLVSVGLTVDIADTITLDAFNAAFGVMQQKMFHG